MSGSDGNAIAASTAGWTEPVIVPPVYGPANFPYDFFPVTYDVQGSLGLAAPLLLGSGNIEAPGFSELVKLNGTLTVEPGAAIDGSTGINSMIEGTGTLINMGGIVSTGGKAGAFANSLLTIGGDPASGLLFRNMGSVVVGGNFGAHGAAAGAGAIVIAAAIDPGSTGTYVLETAGTLEIARDTNRAETFDFAPLAGLGPYAAPQGGTLIIDNPGIAFNDAVIDFTPDLDVNTGLFAGARIPSGTIVVRGIGRVGHAELDSARHVLRLYADTGTADQIYAFTNFDAMQGAADPLASGGAERTIDLTGMIIGTDHVPCLAAGTSIATARGEIAVEALRPGDEVELLTGGRAPVIWIGRRHVDLTAMEDDSLARPIRIMAHAFGDGLPRRDLTLSGDHAVFAEGVLVPARALINGSTIAADDAAREIDYFHVELGAHDVIRAEGLAVESWLDTGNRAMFDNAAEWAEAKAPAAPFAGMATHNFAADGYALVLDRGGIVDDLRSALAARASTLGHRVRQELAVHVARPGWVRVELPGEMVSVRLLSPSGQHGLDLRRLGVLIGGLLLDGEHLALRGTHIERGFHPAEHHGARLVRWTDGEAVLRFAAAAGGRCLDIDVLAMAPHDLAPR